MKQCFGVPIFGRTLQPSYRFTDIDSDSLSVLVGPGKIKLCRRDPSFSVRKQPTNFLPVLCHLFIAVP